MKIEEREGDFVWDGGKEVKGRFEGWLRVY